MARSFDGKTVGTLVLMFVFVTVFWHSPLIYPVKVFVVLLHEVGHGLAAELTGGDVERIELSSNLGGVCWSRGGSRLAVLPAGYLGSMVFGGAILVAAARTRYDKQIAFAIGALMIVLAIWLVRSAFGIAFCLLFGVAMIASARFLSEKSNDLILKFIGLTSSLYAVIDIKEDLISRTVPGSDAYAMSKEFFGPPVFWGVLWILIALVGTAFFVRLAASGEER